MHPSPPSPSYDCLRWDEPTLLQTTPGRWGSAALRSHSVSTEAIRIVFASRCETRRRRLLTRPPRKADPGRGSGVPSQVHLKSRLRARYSTLTSASTSRANPRREQRKRESPSKRPLLEGLPQPSYTTANGRRSGRRAKHAAGGECRGPNGLPLPVLPLPALRVARGDEAKLRRGASRDSARVLSIADRAKNFPIAFATRLVVAARCG